MQIDEKTIYPLKVTTDRYSGCYSGGEYLAWNLRTHEVPIEPFADDVSCMMFWSENDIPVGIGDTVDAKINDLQRKLP